MKKTAIVTGGTGGIGTQIAKMLVKQNRTVVATHRPESEEKAVDWQKKLKTQGFDIHLGAVDVRNYESCSHLLEEIAGRFGSVDILVNNAGVTRDATLKKMSKDAWEEVLRTNLDSHFNMCQPIFEQMCQQGWGRIINISSINGQKGQFGQANYSAAKAGIYGFTKALAQEGARKGVTVNAISPGYIATEMVKSMPQKVIDSIVAQIPVGRLGLPEEVARAVEFLSADDAGFITGSNLTVNGGQYMP